ncbi:MAG: hypothetical protein ACREIP_19640 [Alphaproteobacteria bacterium]
MRSALAIVLVLAGAGCAGTGDDARLPRLGIEFNWNDVPVCSNVSPRLVVQGAPPGTARFRVELVDKDSALARHGGGEVAADPSGVIPQGALQSYRGPCPSQIAVK